MAAVEVHHLFAPSNPLLVVKKAFEQEHSRFFKFIKKKNLSVKTPHDHDMNRKKATMLFDLWSKYEKRLPSQYLNEKIVETGEKLVKMEEYSLALHQCFDRYIQWVEVKIGESIYTTSLTEQNLGTEETNNGEQKTMTLRSLYGHVICTYRMTLRQDPRLESLNTQNYAISLLETLRRAMTVAVANEKLSWLTYNGTIYVYTIARSLMSVGQSAKVLEYLLWAANSMETAIALLTVKYLSWRVTLYAAVCQCYYDCKAGAEAEEFARRALSKIHELAKLERCSSNEITPASELAFTVALAKINVLIFKRSAFMTRQRPKGVFRSKTKPNYKDAVQLPWPRTQTERLLSDMFENKASMLIAVNEALTDVNRRTLITSFASPEVSPDIDVESVLDVYGELFFAGAELCANALGEGSHTQTPWPGNVGSASVMTSSLTDDVPLGEVLRFIKLLYNYEQWEMFLSLVEPARNYFEDGSSELCLAGTKAFQILLAVEDAQPGNPVMSGKQTTKRRVTHEGLLTGDLTANVEIGHHHKRQHPNQQQQQQANGEKDDTAADSSPVMDSLLHLANVLVSCTREPYASAVWAREMDLFIDASLYLWSRCRPVFQRFVSPDEDSILSFLRVDDSVQWLQLLCSLYITLTWAGFSTIDISLYSDIALRLVVALEGIASLTVNTKPFQVYLPAASVIISMLTTPSALVKESGKEVLGESGESGVPFVERQPNAGPLSRVSILQQVEKIVKTGLAAVGAAQDRLMRGITVADTVLFMKGHSDVDVENQSSLTRALEISSMAALRTEFIFVLHRIQVKLLATTAPPPQPPIDTQKPKRRPVKARPLLGDQGQAERLIASCEKNLVSRALLLMQLAVHTRGIQKRQMACNWIQESLALLKQAEQQERRLTSSLALPSTFEGRKLQTTQPTLTPSEPLLVSWNDTSMVFRAAPFIPHNGEKVSWYKLYGRVATGPNAKVRLNDCHLSGLGEEIPVTNDCLLYVTGLKPNEMYMFAVAAYTRDGKLIGNSVGASTRPLLATSYLPLLVTWGLLAQAAYQVAVYDVSRQAALVLWDYFVTSLLHLSTKSTSTVDLKLKSHELDHQKVVLSSNILLRHFVESIFVLVDIAVREDGMFCDLVSFYEPSSNMQADRLRACECLLVALELSGHLNDAQLCLQVIVQCYGLLVPFIHHQLAAQPSILVLMRCHAVLQEFPSATRQFRRTAQGTDYLHHVTAAITYHIAKVLNLWSQRGAAASVLDAGKHLLSSTDTDPYPLPSNRIPSMPCITPALAAQHQKRGGQRSRRTGAKYTSLSFQGVQQEQAANATKSEELKALEAVILQLSTGSKIDEQDITGAEDPNILYVVVATLNSQQAYKEVAKFRRRTRYMEFLVRVVQKAFHEGHRDLVLEWSEETLSWLNRRNETIITPKLTTIPKGQTMALAGDPSRYNAAVVEYTKKPSPVKISRTKKTETKRRSPTQLRRLLQLAAEDVSPQSRLKMLPKEDFAERTSVRTPAFKKADKVKIEKIRSQQLAVLEKIKVTRDEIETKAREVLQQQLMEYWRTIQRRRKLRSISNEEMPWRGQLNIFQALSCFNNYLERIGSRMRATDVEDNDKRRTQLDNEWFGLETTGTLIVGWNGGPRAFREEDEMTTGNVTTTGRQQETGLTETDGDLPALTSETSLLALPDRQPASDAPSAHGIPSQTETAEVPKSQLKDGVQPSESQSPQKPSGKLSTIQKMFLYFRRAIVLSHRGRSWTLLRNASRCLWDCTHTLLSRAVRQSDGRSLKVKASHSHEMVHVLTVERLRSDAWPAFYCAADRLLDMLLQLEEGSRTLIQREVEQKAAQELNKRQVPDKQKSKAKVTAEYGRTEEKEGKDTKQSVPRTSTRIESVSVMSSTLPRRVKSISVETSESKVRDGSQSQTTQMTSTLADSTTLARSVTLPFTIHSSTSADAAESSLSHDRALNPDREGSSETSTEMEETLGVTSASIAAHRKMLSRPVLVGENGWFGGPADEAGGASLTFEARLDKRDVVDLRWVKTIVMQTMQMLFYEMQWEKLVDIAMRFNELTNDRYAEQVSPLVVIAQQRLATRAAVASKLLPSSYEISPGGHIDPTGHRIYNRQTALARVLVPLNVHSSLEAMRQAIASTTHASRSLQYCRKLLMRYLAGHSQGLCSVQLDGVLGAESVRSSRVFADDEQMVDTTVVDPPILHSMTTARMEDVENRPLQDSQVAAVVVAYDKTIESLLVKKNPGVAAQAMHELGNLHFHLKNIRGAYKCWAGGVDTIIGLEDGVREWRSLTKTADKTKKTTDSTSSTEDSDCDLSHVMLKLCGIWGCLQAAIMASNISQFIVHSDLSQRLEYCLLSACLMKGVFRASLPHPQADCDYATYDVGTDGNASEIIPGVDLFSDRFRCDVQSLTAAAGWNIEELLRRGHFLKALPLISLHHYVSCMVCRDVRQTVQSRLWRLEALTGVCYFSEAIHVLSELVCGYRLPQTGSTSFVPVESRMTSVKFSNGLPLTDQSNYKVMTQLFKKPFPPSLALMYGKHLTSALTVAQAQLQIKMASTVNIPPISTEIPGLFATTLSSTSMKKSSSKQALKRGSRTALSTTVLEVSHLVDDHSVSCDSVTSFTSRGSRYKSITIVPSIGEIRGGLLEEAEKTIDSMVHCITEPFGDQVMSDIVAELSPSDVELLSQCLLMLSDIARQYDHLTPSSQYALQAMQLITDYLTAPEDKSDRYSLYDVHCRRRLDARLWLQCRLAVVQSSDVNASLMCRGVESDDFLGHCRQGQKEAESLGDIEMWLEFTFIMAFSLWLKFDKTGEAFEGFVEILERSARLRALSPSSQQLLAMTSLFVGDLKLKMKSNETDGDMTASLAFYRKAEKEIYNLIMTHGESVVWGELNTTLASLRNIYLPSLSVLSCVKLRIGVCLSQQAVSNPDGLKIFEGTRLSRQTPYLKTPRFTVLKQPSALSSVMSLVTGQQHLTIGASTDGKTSSPWLIPAIVCGAGLDIAHVTARQEHQLEAALSFVLGIAERHLAEKDQFGHREAASVILSAIRNSVQADFNLSLVRKAYLEVALTYLESTARPLPDSLLNKMETGKGKESKAERVRKERLKELEKERQKELAAAWIAVRSASLTAEAVCSLATLLGEGQSDAVLRPLEDKEQWNLPVFVKLALSEQNELRFLDLLKGAESAEHAVTHHHAVHKMMSNSNCPDVGWVLLLRFAAHLRSQVARLSHNGLPEASASPGVGCGTLTRVSQMHDFLRDYFIPYGSKCLPPIPTKPLNLPHTPLERLYQPEEGTVVIETAPLLQHPPEGETSRASSSDVQLSVSGENEATVAGDNEVCIQWYRTPFSDPTAVTCLYALNSKATRISSSPARSPLMVGQKEVRAAAVEAIHKQLSALETEAAARPSTPGPVARSRRGTDSGVVVLPVDIQTRFRKSVHDILALLGCDLQISLECTSANISRLVRLFRPTQGALIKCAHDVYEFFKMAFST